MQLRLNASSAPETGQAVTMSAIQLFPASGSLEFVQMETPGRLPGMQNGNKLIIVRKDRYSKLARAVPQFKTTVLYITSIFMDKRII